MADAPGLDHPLLAVGQADEGAELDDLLLGEVLAQAGPDGLVGALGIPDEHARVEQCRLLALSEAVGALEIEEVFVVPLGQPLLSAPERPLRPSVVAVDRLRDVDAAELFERMLDEPVPEDGVPGARERLRDGGNMRADRLCLGPRRPEAASLLEVLDQLGVGQGTGVDVADARHGAQASR